MGDLGGRERLRYVNKYLFKVGRQRGNAALTETFQTPFHRMYLYELGEISSLPITLGAVVLTIVKEREAPAAARDLLARVEQAEFSLEKRKNIVDIVTSIMVYKLKNSSRAEVKEMLGIDVIDLSEEPRAIREAKEEALLSVVTRLLARRLGLTLSEEIKVRLASLSLSELKGLSVALLDFRDIDDLQSWLDKRAGS